MTIRRLARVIALQSLYQIDIAGAELEAAVASVINEYEATIEEKNASADKKISPKTVAYAFELVRGVIEHKTKIDAKLEAYAKKWSVHRMPVIDRNLMRVAVYEIFFAEEAVPESVAINEAVEIAKSYGEDNTPRFVNGVLGKMVRDAQSS